MTRQAKFKKKTKSKIYETFFSSLTIGNWSEHLYKKLRECGKNGVWNLVHFQFNINKNSDYYRIYFNCWHLTFMRWKNRFRKLGSSQIFFCYWNTWHFAIVICHIICSFYFYSFVWFSCECVIVVVVVVGWRLWRVL